GRAWVDSPGAEPASAPRHHGHHHHRADSDQGADRGMVQAVLKSGTPGASADTTSNADGSSTTTITYADGSKVALTLPPGSGNSGTSSDGAGSASDVNFLEQLIRLQAQSLTVSPSQSLTSA